MEKKLPHVYANKVDKKAGNNDFVYYSNSKRSSVSHDDINSDEGTVKKNINQKLNDIFNSANYIYKANVKIKFKDGTSSKKIVGKNSTHIITIENELIPISDIIDIELE